MSEIVAGGCSSYDVDIIQAFLARAFAEFNTLPAGGKVLLKPNLLLGKPPEKAVNTHPILVRAVALMLLERGCSIFVGDSPGYESTEKALERSGIMDIVRDLQSPCRAFQQKSAKGGRERHLAVQGTDVRRRDPLDFDFIINMPKLKTHAMVGLTAGVWNLFGFVPSLGKAKWHLRCGADKRLFTSLLLDIYTTVGPGLTVLDGIIAMDGEGPTNGRPRNLGIVAVSDDAIALDAFLEKRLSIPFPLPVSVMAAEKGLLKEADVVDLGMPAVRDLLLPPSMEVDWNLPPLIRETVRRVFTRKPKCAPQEMQPCRNLHKHLSRRRHSRWGNENLLRLSQVHQVFRACSEMCPAGAISA